MGRLDRLRRLKDRLCDTPANAGLLTWVKSEMSKERRKIKKWKRHGR